VARGAPPLSAQDPICRTWDRLLWLDEARLEQLASPGEDEDEVRRRVRVEAAEHALRTVQADPFVALFAFRDDLERRRARWAHLHTTPATRRRNRYGRYAWRLLVSLAATVILSVILTLLLGAIGLVALLLVFPASIAGARDETPAAFDESRCPDCAYDLTGVPPAIPRERLGLNSGPRACPECGASWPLLPPPG
jgi:hypothetical protein